MSLTPLLITQVTNHKTVSMSNSLMIALVTAFLAATLVIASNDSDPDISDMAKFSLFQHYTLFLNVLAICIGVLYFNILSIALQKMAIDKIISFLIKNNKIIDSLNDQQTDKIVDKIDNFFGVRTIFYPRKKIIKELSDIIQKSE